MLFNLQAQDKCREFGDKLSTVEKAAYNLESSRAKELHRAEQLSAEAYSRADGLQREIEELQHDNEELQRENEALRAELNKTEAQWQLELEPLIQVT